MSKKLERFVQEQRANFDVMEPSAAIWDKIEDRIAKKRSFFNYSFMWKAAAIIIVFGFSFWAQLQIEETPSITSTGVIQNRDIAVAETIGNKETPAIAKTIEPVIPEFVETEKYYSRKVNNTMKELKVYLVKYPEVAVDMKKDIAELDSVYRVLKRDLGDDVAQEEILKAMIQNYRMKLQILEDIKNELMQNSTNNSTTKQESHEI